MDPESRYWLSGNPDEFEFGWLYRIIDGYLNPEAEDFDALQDLTRTDDPVSAAFKRQLRASIEKFDDDIDQHLDYITAYPDGSGIRYLRRLWRDLYPGEPVPGGDDEFRDALRAAILQDLDELPLLLVRYIDFRLPDFRPAARALWQRQYPDEPVPQS